MKDLQSLTNEELQQELNQALSYINVYIDGLNTRKFDLVVTEHLKQRGYNKTSGELIALVKETTK